LELYASVIRRVDEQTNELVTQVLTGLADDETTFNPGKFREFLANYLRAYFDFLTANPRIVRI